MKIYVAGKLGTESERENIEKIASFCETLGFETFLPHRDVGFVKGIGDVKRIFEGDIIAGLSKCKIVVVALDGLHVGAGTAWEMGYGYAHKMPIIGLKSDEPVSEALDYLSPILIASTKIVTSFDELKRELLSFKRR